MNKQELLAREFFGHPGRMVSGSKGRYGVANPSHFTVFNGNLCTDDGKIWYGDVDVTLDLPKLRDLAKALKESIYLLYESDGRFQNKAEPKLSRAVVQVTPKGEVTIREDLKDYVEMTDTVRLIDKTKYKQVDFPKAVKLPEITKFASKSAKVSPMEKLVLWVAEQMGKTPKGTLPAPYNIYLLEEDFAVLEWLTKNWIRKFYTGDDEYATAKEYGYYNLNMGVSTFYQEDPRWAKPGHAYVKDGLFVKVNQE